MRTLGIPPKPAASDAIHAVRRQPVASDLSFVEYVCDQLDGVERVTHRKMFGEYAIYVGEKVVGLVCDNQLFVKPTDAGRALLKEPVMAPPYPGAKPSFLIAAELDDSELVSALFKATANELPEPKPKKPKAKKKVAPRRAPRKP
jgi:TfoX/Sxy family transcriptional regulator of competence genes